MRTRNRTVISETVSLAAENLPFTEDDSPGTTFHINWPAKTVNIVYNNEIMVDVDTGDRVKPNPCEHHKQSVRLLSPGLAVYDEASNPGHNGAAHYSGRPLQWYVASEQVLGNITWNLDLTPLPSRLSINAPDVDETSLLQDLLDRAQGQIADHALNLSELDELPSAYHGMVNLAKPAQQNWERFRRLLRNSSQGSLNRLVQATLQVTAASPTGKIIGGKALRKSLRFLKGNVIESAGRVANAHLAYKFGIMPLLQDITKTWQFAKSAKDKLSKFQDGKPIRLSKQIPTTVSFDDSATGLGAKVAGHYKWEAKPAIYDTNCDSRYVLLLKPNLSGLRGISKTLNDMVNRFGPSGPTAFAWEKVPFSFVVDWFVDSRAVLRGLDGLFGFNAFKIIGFTRSTTLSANCQVSVSHRKTDGSLILDWLGAEFDWKYYKRSVIQPKINFRPRHRFGKSQALISAALITQFLLGLRRSR